MAHKRTFHLFIATVFLTILLIPLVLPPPSHCAVSEVRIGVLANRGKEAATSAWWETASYLSRTIPKHLFTIIPLDFNEVDPAVRLGTVDFILVNPQIYVELEAKYGVSRIATLKSRTRRGIYDVLGGVIICRADRREIENLQDLKGKSFMAVEEGSLGGWAAAWRELKTEGIDPRRDFTQLSFGGKQDTVVYAVRDREVDAGTVRTGTLEHMADEGKINIAEFRILNRQDEENFALALSTRLYPEWPFAKVRHTSDDLARSVAVSLLAMRPGDPAATSAGLEGWNVPLSYQSVHDLMKELRIGRYHDYGKVNLESVIREYWHLLAAALLLLILMGMATLYVVRLNRVLRHSRLDLEKSRNELETKVKEQTAELRNSERRLADILNLLPDTTFAVDMEGKVILWNRSAEELTGVKASDILGKGEHEYSVPFFGKKRPILIDRVLNPSAEMDNQEKLYSYLKREGEMIIGECYVRSARRGEAYVFGIAAPLYDSEGNITGAIESIRDITERKEMERLKDEMISAVSHEMRTPLTALMGYAEILLKNDVDPRQQKEFLGIIYKETERLNELIGNFLDLQRFKCRLESSECQPLYIPLLLRETATLFAASECHIMTVDCPPDLPNARGNCEQLRQVFNNLVSNAVKYSPAGGEIRLGGRREEDSIIVTVSDKGIGIPPEAREKVFERFYRVDNSDRRAIGGTGLGLALVKEIIVAHGGRVWVESEAGRGSTFFVLLPVA